MFVLSSFLDNIAAALIGGTMAAGVFRKKVHIGYLAAIVACSNAGGAGSVVGDTTTTMMWIDGVSPIAVLDAYVAAVRRAARVRDPRRHPAAALRADHQGRDGRAPRRLDAPRASSASILLAAIGANVVANLHFPAVLDHFPVIGAAVWVAILAHRARRAGPTGSLLPEAFKGSIFLLALVTCASLMPVEKLPAASWQTTFGLGFVSAVFDNIPLTALALKQGGYDWGMLAYAVGFGGSMIWFGSSAGVAISNMYPAGEVGRTMAAARLARGAGLRGRLPGDAGGRGLAPDRQARARPSPHLALRNTPWPPTVLESPASLHPSIT